MKNLEQFKILIFTTRFFPHVGGVENVVQNIAKYSAFNINIITGLDFFNNHLQKIFAYKNESWEDKVTIYRLWINIPRSIFGFIAFPYRFLVTNVAIFLLMQKNRYKIVNYHFPDDSLVYFLIAHFIFRFKFIVNIHGNDIQVNADKKIYKKLFALLFKKANYIVVNSSYIKEQIKTRYGGLDNKIKIIPNGIDLDLYKNIKDALAQKDKYIFSVGRMVEKKGFDILIKAFAVSKASESVKLIIEGTGPESAKLKILAKSLKLGEKIVFMDGKLNEMQKIVYMKNAIIGVVPSKIEPFGIVALEFMACGTPLIASNTGGLSDLVDGKNTGLLFNNQDVNDLAQKIDMLIVDLDLLNNLSYGEYNFVKDFDIKKIVSKYDDLYQKLI